MTTAEDNIATIRHNYDALSKGDPGPMLASFAPGYRYTCHTRNRFHGTYTVEGLMGMMGEAFTTQQDTRFEIVDITAISDDMVVAHNRVSFAVDDRRIDDADVVAVFTFEDGKIVDSVEVNSARLNAFWQDMGDDRDRVAAS